MEEEEKKDREIALKLHQEELGNGSGDEKDNFDEEKGHTVGGDVGVEEQRKLLSLYRPRSPRKLRDGKVVDRRSSMKRRRTMEIQGQENRDPEQGSSSREG